MLQLIISALLLLAACSPTIEATETVTVRNNGPEVTVARTKAQIGEYIDVKVSVLVGLDSTSSHAERHADIQVGVCLQQVELGCRQITVDEALESGIPVPEGVLFAEGGSPVKTFNLDVKRGEQMTLEHSFRMTSKLPGDYTLLGFALAKVTEEASIGYVLGSESGPDPVVSFE